MSEWTSELYVDAHGNSPFETWMDRLDEITWEAADNAIRDVLEVRGLSLSKTSWLDPLGGGLYEFRIAHTAKQIDELYAGAKKRRPKGPNEVLVRVFVHFYGAKICLLLGGYDKLDDVSKKRQDREIATARRRLAEWSQREREKAKAAKHRR